MARTKRKLKIALWILLGSFLVLQLVPAGRSNPEVTGDLAAPPEVKAALVRCCYDCHSNQTRWPWYAYVNPVAFLIVSDTNTGRRKLNFSAWSGYSTHKRYTKAGDAVDEIHEGRMPMHKYVWMHDDARLTPQEIQAIQQWSESLPAED